MNLSLASFIATHRAVIFGMSSGGSQNRQPYWSISALANGMSR